MLFTGSNGLLLRYDARDNSTKNLPYQPTGRSEARAFYGSSTARTGVLIDADGSSRDLVVPPDVPTASQFAASPDGRAFVVFGEPPAPGAYLVKADGSTTAIATNMRVGGVSWSPDGRTLAIIRCVVCGALVDDSEVYVYDLATSSLRLLYAPPSAVSVTSFETPGARIEVRCFCMASWSPDSRFVVGRPSWFAGVSSDRLREQGRVPLVVIEVATGRQWSLEPVPSSTDSFLAFSSWIGWGAPHSLAYVANDGSDRWPGRLRIWSPDDGARTVATGAVYSPSWDATGRLLTYVRGDPVGASAARTIVDSAAVSTTIVSLDVRTGASRALEADHVVAARSSRDGRDAIFIAANGGSSEMRFGRFDSGRWVDLFTFQSAHSLTVGARNGVAWSR